ncbi:MAG: hypothetical protein M3003_04875 [Candidatus Dormibacteraeota bacterium]|nr:hypothetical protein [Candidatus Dormibacteraeota bacterium]
MNASETLITPALAAEVANAVSGDSLERFVAEIPAESVPLYLARLTDAATNIRALTKGLEVRLVNDGQVGQHWTIGNTEYGFFGALKTGWKDIPNLIANLMRLGISPADIAPSISELRVTDLRMLAEQITDAERREEAMELINGARVPKGERGAPRFTAIDPRYTNTAKE